jgi:polyisoprenoid-binding protein YceI
MSTYVIDNSHSEVGFSVRHMVFAKVRGHFGKWAATLQLDPSDVTRSSVEVKIDANSIDTREEKRDGHLRSPDFLDTARYPELAFKSRRVATIDGKRFEVVGDLTIRDVTREVTLEVEELGRGTDPWGNDRIAFTAKTAINRADFGLKWNQALETGGVLVGDKVEIEINLEAMAARKAA